MKYALAFPKHTNRPMYYENKSADVEWVVDKSYGSFDSSIDAKRAYLISMKELTGDCTDDFIKLHFSKHQKMGLVRVQKVEAAFCGDRAYDMGVVDGMRLTYKDGNVFATPAKA